MIDFENATNELLYEVTKQNNLHTLSNLKWIHGLQKIGNVKLTYEPSVLIYFTVDDMNVSINYVACTSNANRRYFELKRTDNPLIKQSTHFAFAHTEPHKLYLIRQEVKNFKAYLEMDKKGIVPIFK
ncbi:hypothetical protein [Cohnella sp. WQ 127256]|uniref:hypothetical protein n=1 Tax=Cohnella sp. WQ 127256 TaxID=2938790 RepID=UPI0021187A6F|nr:hypothetical protein [Cohnella sp. WQ 127256]